MNTLQASANIGLPGDGTEQSTAFIQAAQKAASQNIPLQLAPKGNYVIDQWVNVPDNLQVICPTGDAKVSTTKDGDGNMIFCFAKTKNAAFDGFSMEAPSSNTAAFTAYNCNGVSLTNLKMKNISVLNTNEIGYSKTHVDADLCQNITIGNVTGVGSKDGYTDTSQAFFGRVGIELRYVKGVKIYNVNLSQYSHGIIGWGGDSDPSANGDPANTRFAKNIEVYNAFIRNVGNGGIFVSMGDGLHIHHNDVKYCGDTGLDPEGCINTLYEYNKSDMGRNGSATLFFLGNNVTFANNYLRNDPGRWAFAFYNGGQSGQGKYDTSKIGTTSILSNTFDGGMVGQGQFGKIITDGKNSFINGATQNWSGGVNQLPNENGAGATGSIGITPSLNPGGIIKPPVITPPKIDVSKIQEDVNLCAGLAIKIQNDLNALLH